MVSLLVRTVHNSIKRFAKYSSVGVSTFLFDLLLLYVCIDVLGMPLLFSTGLAYLIAVSCNYYLSRKYVFSKTLRRVDHGYYAFLSIAGLGMLLVVSLMAILVDFLQIEYLLARILVAGAVGMWNYLLNLFVNFKVVGIH